MKLDYWYISDAGELLSRCDLRLIDLRNSDDSYGSCDSVDVKFILSVNVVQALHQLGFPLDSPRLMNCLTWIKENATKTNNVHLGRIFRLMTHRHFPNQGLCLDEDWEYLEALVTGNSFVDCGVLRGNPTFPLMALDILATKVHSESLASGLLSYVDSNRRDFMSSGADASYLAYVSYLHSAKSSSSLPSQLSEAALTKMGSYFDSGLWDRSVVKTGYCALNLSRLPKPLLDRHQLTNKVQLCRQTVGDFVRRMELDAVEMSEVPLELAAFPDAKEIYSLSVFIRGLVSGENVERRQLDFAHALLRNIYINLYDPVSARYAKLRRWVQYYYPITFLVAAIAFITLYSTPGIAGGVSLIGAVATIAGLALSIVALTSRKRND